MDDFLKLPLDEPPRIFYAGVGIHGGNPVENYLLPNLWCLHLCRYHALWVVDDQDYLIEPGTAIFIPRNTPMEFRFSPGRHVHISIHFAVRADENQWRDAPGIAAHQNLRAGFQKTYGALEEAVGWFSTAPLRAQARIWEVLLSLVEPEHRQLDALVSRAMELIELRLHEPLSIAQLARELDVSHNHLTRRLRAATGLTPVDFIRERRIRHAQYLLRHSTLPIKAIAAQSGLGDFHSFNKAMRRVTGFGPRQWRLDETATR